MNMQVEDWLQVHQVWSFTLVPCCTTDSPGSREVFLLIQSQPLPGKRSSYICCKIPQAMSSRWISRLSRLPSLRVYYEDFIATLGPA